MGDAPNLLWTGQWREREIDELLLAQCDLSARGIRVKRLNRTALCGLSAALAADASCDGLLSAGGERSGLVVGLHWLSDEGIERFVRQVAAKSYSATAVQDFAHMGGSPLLHYVAQLVGIHGYATCIFEADSWDQVEGVQETILRSGLVDQLLTIRIRLRTKDDAVAATVKELELRAGGPKLGVACEEVMATVLGGARR